MIHKIRIYIYCVLCEMWNITKYTINVNNFEEIIIMYYLTLQDKMSLTHSLF